MKRAYRIRSRASANHHINYQIETLSTSKSYSIDERVIKHILRTIHNI